MDKTMRFACLVKAGETEIRERPIPKLGPHQVLVRNESCNICTTEYGQWQGKRDHQGYPMCGGHENSGYVAAVGSDVTKVKVGDYVATCESYAGCGTCDFCLQGQFLHCDCSSGTRTEDDYLGEFGFSTYQVDTDKYLFKMNPEIDSACVCFLEPLATVIRGQKKLRLEPAETVVIIGGGTMGILNGLMARAHGTRVIISELIEKKLKVSQDYGFETIDSNKFNVVEEVKRMTDGQMADAVIIAVGAQSANDQALKLIKQLDGRVLYFAAGYPTPMVEIDSNTIHYRRIELIGTYGANIDDFLEASKLINSKVIDPSKLVEEKRFNLSDMQSAFAYAATPGMYRVNVKCQK